jgi:activating signal cointegrator 1
VKAITIHQPWASLIALGEKRFETRGWPTKYRGPIAIHAGLSLDRIAFVRAPVRAALLKHGILAIDDLPTGRMIATATLEDCLQVTRPYGEQSLVNLKGDRTTLLWGGLLPDEYHFGDYSDGRYAWSLTNVQTLPEPVPVKGQQGLWNWEPCSYA